MFRKTARNLSKLKTFSTALRATILRPYYPASDLYRVVRDDGLQVDFMPTVHGVRTFEGLRERASAVEIDGVTIRVASLADIIKSKRAARRPQDLAALDVLERTLEETNQQKKKARRAPPGK